jgi:hypothetical protein
VGSTVRPSAPSFRTPDWTAMGDDGEAGEGRGATVSSGISRDGGCWLFASFPLSSPRPLPAKRGEEKARKTHHEPATITATRCVGWDGTGERWGGGAIEIWAMRVVLFCGSTTDEMVSCGSLLPRPPRSLGKKTGYKREGGGRTIVFLSAVEERRSEANSLVLREKQQG